jgi:hypothetical protein
LLEFATGQNPHSQTRITTNIVKNGSNLEFIYTRSAEALGDGVTYTVEWSDTLAVNSWSSADVPQQGLTDNGTLHTMKASIPAGSNQRFVRLKVEN